MKTTIGGDRLGSGNKQNISLRNYERSTHDLSYLWRSSMAAGTLVPFMSLPALPGDSFDIDLACEVLTLPTVGPLFGSFKVQLDVFAVPMRLYNAELHMNRLGIGMDMSNVFLPRIRVAGTANDSNPEPLDDNAQINPSCLWAYLGIRGIGRIIGSGNSGYRYFNAVPILAYWDIYKNYYANKQEERGFAIHTDDSTIIEQQAVKNAIIYKEFDNLYYANCYNNAVELATPTDYWLFVQFGTTAEEPQPTHVFIEIEGVSTTLAAAFTTVTWTTMFGFPGFKCENPVTVTADTDWEVPPQSPVNYNEYEEYQPFLEEFPLSNIDDMRLSILQHAPGTPYTIIGSADSPYSLPLGSVQSGANLRRSCRFSQEGLGIKTYQSDLFNNWISTEWIDGTNGVNEVTAVDTSGGSFTIDALNLANKVYNMLNRIAISGGTYDDWLDAVYTHERAKSVESPVYLGSLIKELGFEEVISNADVETENSTQPLGTLAGRGRLTNKNKGGSIKCKVDEPSYLMGIVSLTPRVDYSQGNSWDVNIATMNDWHKPALDAIGFQDLITDQMAWQATTIDTDDSDTVAFTSAGKQPAWINYMTAVNKTYGNFAINTKEMFMTLNRRYDVDSTGITDLTTYIDPTKFNHIFADTNLDAQNFWVQISNNITARRKMSAKVIPNL